MKPKTKSTKLIALATLVEDFALYPRNKVDDTHIGDLVRALQAEAEFPPIIACASTLRVVDGFHRRRAMLSHFGPEAKADVELRHYATDADLFLDAVTLNSHHGRRLDRHDQARIVIRLRELEVDDQTIAVSLHVPESRIAVLSVRVIYDQSGQAYPSKRGIEHLRGQRITDEQIRVMGSVRSAEAGRLCLELTRLLEAELVDLSDAGVIARLRVLQAAVESVLGRLAA